jgi:hypothetical protein
VLRLNFKARTFSFCSRADLLCRGLIPGTYFAYSGETSRRRFDGLREGLQEALDLLRGVVLADRDPRRREGVLLVPAEREQQPGGLVAAAGARRPAPDGVAEGVEHEHEALRAHAADGDVGVVGEPALGVPVQLHVRHGEEAFYQLVA